SSGTVSLADPQQGQLVGTLGDPESSVTALAISGDGARVLSGGADCLAQLWAPGQPGRRFAEHTDTIRAVAFCPDSRHALSAGLDRAIWRWNLEGEAVQDPVVPAEFPEAVLHMAFSLDT